MVKNIAALPQSANTIVAGFIDKLFAIRPNFVEGIYLTGSIPMNDFHPTKSDIDFLVFCNELPDEQIASQLKRMHQTTEKQFPKPNLSGVYLTSAAIETDEPGKVKVLYYDNGSMHYGAFEMAIVNLSELKTNAITIFGVEADNWPINISRDKLNNFLHQNINSYWAKWVKQHNSWFSKKLILLLFPRFTEWVVLGLARQLFTLKTGKIVSKTEAGYYCLECFPQKYHHVIKRAIEIRKDNRTYPLVKSYLINPSFKRLAQTIACADYIISAFNEACLIRSKKIKSISKPF
jgi:hypothetical protein